MKNNKEYWITNISKTNICLSDLGLTINAYLTVILLDSKYYYYTEEQIEKSATIGSIYKRKDKLIKREIAPEIIKHEILINKNEIIPSRERSTYSIKQEIYEELNITDEQFADANAELADLDQQPLVKKEQQYVPTKKS